MEVGYYMVHIFEMLWIPILNETFPQPWFIWNILTTLKHTWYLSFFLHEQNFWRIRFTPKKTRKLRQNTQKIANFLRYYGKIHSKLTIFRVKSVKIYTGQKKFTRTCSWGSWQISGMWGMTIGGIKRICQPSHVYCIIENVYCVIKNVFFLMWYIYWHVFCIIKNVFVLMWLVFLDVFKYVFVQISFQSVAKLPNREGGAGVELIC